MTASTPESTSAETTSPGSVEPGSVEPETTEPTDVEPSEKTDVVDPAPSRLRRLLRHPRTVPAAAAVVMAASVAGAATAYAQIHLPDQATDDAARAAVLDAATDGTVALLSYGHQSLNTDFAEARTHLTGQFLTYYNEFTEKVVTPAATDNTVDTTAEVVRSAVSEISDDRAQVLAFVNQTTTSKAAPEPELTSSSVRVALQRVDGQWRISSFDPV